jgi:hypothetical protein
MPRIPRPQTGASAAPETAGFDRPGKYDVPTLVGFSERTLVQANIYADVIASRRVDDPEALLLALGETARALNQGFAPTLIIPFAVDFGDELRGALADPTQVPLCVSFMRESLAPHMVRVGVGVDEPAEDAFTRAKREDRLIHYAGVDTGGDLLLNAYCRLLDPLIRKRSAKQWEAIRALRECGQRKHAAAKLGITRQSLAERLKAGHWKVVEDADATIAAYLALLQADVDQAGRTAF